MEQYSLLKILRDDPDFAGALKKTRDAVKKDKANLVQAANQFNEKYHEEIVEGTKLHQKLLSEGQAKGLTEEQVFAGSSKFLPTVQTPILNYLFFIMRDEKPTQNLQAVLEEYIKKFGYSNDEMTDLYLKGLSDSLPEGYDDKETDFDDVITEENTNQPEEMDSFIYGNLSTNEFRKLKKLKALSKSPNDKEAFLAYKKCLELCKKWNLDFDKVPCNIK